MTSLTADSSMHRVAVGYLCFASRAPVLEQYAVTLSVGIAVLIPSERYASAQCLVDLADEALYQAKRRGRNIVVVRDVEDDPISLPV